MLIPETSSIIQTEKVIFRNIYVYICISIHALTINGKGAMNLKETREWFEVRIRKADVIFML